MIIAIEGVVCAGKTTMSSYLAEQLNCQQIHEYGYFTKGHGNFPAFPPHTAKDIVEATQFFLGIEQIRYALLMGMVDPSNKNQLIVVDRMYYSCLAFDYATSNHITFDPVMVSRPMWEKALKIEPDFIFVLDIDYATFVARSIARGTGLLSHFKNPVFFNMQRNFYKSLVQCDNRATILDGRSKIEEGMQCVLKTIYR